MLSIEKNQRILVVDDSSHRPNLMQKLLQCWGYQNVSVFNGNNALSKLAFENFDLLIIDQLFSDTAVFTTKARHIQSSLTIICEGVESYDSLPYEAGAGISSSQKFRLAISNLPQSREMSTPITI
jgi:PleD family two-component response regulator